MNSVGRPRKRPRVESVSFRVFFRLLAFEAALLVFFPRGRVGLPLDDLRRTWRRSPDVVRASADRYLKHFPERRFVR